jgi:hypothetical protein
MADTIYTKDSYSALYKYIRATLQKEGTCICSCQTHYYGVGGSLHDWTEFIESYNELKIELKHELSDRMSIDRNIIYITWNPEKYTTSKLLPDIEKVDQEQFLEF